jgi:hypothetical protein
LSIYEILDEFPNLQADNFSPTSDCTDDYNCIAWAAGDTTRKWEPLSFWPVQDPQSERGRIFSLISVFQELGYSVCSGRSLEAGYEKVAIYGHGTEWDHAARQLENGKWTSKLGDLEDIEHETLDCLVSQEYGEVLCLMKRPRAG